MTLKVDGKEYLSIRDYEEIKKNLENGNSVVHWEEGTSLYPIIKDREYCLIKPIKSIDDIKLGDCVFCLVRGYYMVHRVIDIIVHPTEGKYLEIGDTWNNVFGWTQNVYGIATSTGFFKDFS